MKAILKSHRVESHSPEHVNYTLVYLDSITNFNELDYLNVELDIGSENSKGSDQFSFSVFTDEYFFSKYEPKMLKIWDRDLVLPWGEKITKEIILNRINQALKDAQGETWDDIVRHLCKYFYWEFEGEYGVPK